MRETVIETAEAKRIRDVHIPFIGQDSRSENDLTSLRMAARASYPDRVLRDLEALSAMEYDDVALCIRKLSPAPLDLPPTPLRPPDAPNHQLTWLSEVIHLGIAAILGEPLSYRAEKSGVLVQHVYPVESQKNAPSNESSASTLSLHTEIALSVENLSNPARIDSPDFVLLLCLRADPNRRAATLIAAVDDLCAHLSGSELSTLQDARFELRAPYSFTPTHVERPWLGPVRILDDTNGKRVAAFDLACGCRGMDREAQKALEQLKVAATSMAATTQVYLESGDLLILDNQRCAHGRTSFPAGFDGRDRWLQRMYVRRSLEGMHPVQPGFRVF